MLRRWRSCCSNWASRRFVKEEATPFTDMLMEGLLPYHKTRMLARPLIREILREIEITIDDYNNHIKKYRSRLSKICVQFFFVSRQ